MSTNRFAPADWLLDYLEGQEHEKISTAFGELARNCDFSAKELQKAGCQRSLKSSPKRSLKSSPSEKDWMGDFFGAMGTDPIPA